MAFAVVAGTRALRSTPVATMTSGSSAARPLRVCADPNNLPFSNARGEGFENRIAELLARDIGAQLEYTWWPQRRGFVRNTLAAGRCDVVLGVPAGYEMVLPTRPFYRSTYVFVTRTDRGLRIRSLDDSVLRRLSIGVHMIGDDYANTPPAQALARRGIIENVHGYTIYGDYSKPDPPAELVRAVERGEIDVAIAWGPLAGYFAQRSTHPLTIVPVTPARDGADARFVFAIAAGVRKGDTVTRALVQRELDRNRAQIHAVLERYGVPLVEENGS
jgi:quinoprotein dehydrogenase-associated probable ABC transporter substrate-binding protein